MSDISDVSQTVEFKVLFHDLKSIRFRLGSHNKSYCASYRTHRNRICDMVSYASHILHVFSLVIQYF